LSAVRRKGIIDKRLNFKEPEGRKEKDDRKGEKEKTGHKCGRERGAASRMEAWKNTDRASREKKKGE